MLKPIGILLRDFTESLSFEFFEKEASMPKGREKERELRRKHRKNQQRLKALEQAQQKAGAKK